jgi:hypothetical protein
MHGNLAWLPTEISDINGEMYLTLRVTDPGLAALFGVSLRANKFLEELQLARDSACEAAVDVKVEELFSCDVSRTSRTKQRSLRARVVQEHSQMLPKTVQIQMELNEDTSADFVLPFEADKRRCVAVRCAPEALEALANGCGGAVGQSERNKKPRYENVPAFRHPEVKYHNARLQPYVRWRDADGKLRYHAHPVEHSADRAVWEDTLRAAGDALHEFYIENNVGADGSESEHSDGVDEEQAEDADVAQQPLDADGGFAEAAIGEP